MVSTIGNIELIETMHVLNRLHSILNGGIGRIKLINPTAQTGIETPNE